MTAADNNTSFKGGVQYVWDATSLTIAEECYQKYQYKMIEGWQNEAKSFHLRFGSHYATALEHYYKHRALGADTHEALELVIDEALQDTWDDYEYEENVPVPNSGYPWLSGDNAKTRENLIRSIIWYVDQFEFEDIKVVILEGGAPAVEHSFTLPVDDGINLAGHLDRLVDYSNGNYVMDQKTTGSTISQYFFNQFSPHMQMSLYTFAGKAIFHTPVKGVIIDAAQIAVGFTRFERGFTFRTDSQLNEWYDDTMHLIEDIRHHTRENHFPKKLSSCGNYGGCEFRAVCSRSPEVRKNFLAADFKPGWVWDPLLRR